MVLRAFADISENMYSSYFQTVSGNSLKFLNEGCNILHKTCWGTNILCLVLSVFRNISENIIISSTPQFLTPSRSFAPLPMPPYSNSLSVYCFLNNKPYLDKSKEFNAKEMNVQVKRIFIDYSFFLVTMPAWKFLQPAILVCGGASIPYLKINSPFFCCLLLFEEYLNPQFRIN